MRIMKRGFVLLFICLFAVSVSAQIVDFEIVSSKTYDNNTSTTYLTLVGDFDKALCDEIVSDLESYPEIQKFSFYDKTNPMKCMFTADLSFDAEIIVQLLNDIVANSVYNESPGFVNVWTSDSGKEIFFRIENIANDIQRKQIEEALVKDDLITNAVINGDDCKIMTIGNFTPEYLQTILDRFGVELSSSSIK
jgi:hypothetical protein